MWVTKKINADKAPSIGMKKEIVMQFFPEASILRNRRTTAKKGKFFFKFVDQHGFFVLTDSFATIIFFIQRSCLDKLLWHANKTSILLNRLCGGVQVEVILVIV
jgi:hypothetical protein